MKRSAICAVLLVAACSPHVRENEAGQTPSENEPTGVGWAKESAPATGPVLATMVTRDYRLAVHQTEGDTVFTVSNATGVLAKNIGLWELARDYPQLHRQYETAFAGEGIELDARVEHFAPER